MDENENKDEHNALANAKPAEAEETKAPEIPVTSSAADGAQGGLKTFTSNPPTDAEGNTVVNRDLGVTASAAANKGPLAPGIAPIA